MDIDGLGVLVLALVGEEMAVSVMCACVSYQPLADKVNEQARTKLMLGGVVR